MEQMIFNDPGKGSSNDAAAKTNRMHSGFFTAAAVLTVLFVIAGCFIILSAKDDPSSAQRTVPTSQRRGDARKETIEDAQISGLSDEVYTGSEVLPSPELRLNGVLLTEGSDYYLEGSDNTLPGKAHLMIFGIGEYEGEIYLDFDIVMDDPVCDDPENASMIEFINRFYNIVYARNGSRDEMISSVHGLCDGSLDGISLAESFFSSQEMVSRNLSDDEFVCLLYRTLLGRRAENEGRQSWCSVLSEGTTREEVVSMFASSNEYQDLCRRYGL